MLTLVQLINLLVRKHLLTKNFSSITNIEIHIVNVFQGSTTLKKESINYKLSLYNLVL